MTENEMVDNLNSCTWRLGNSGDEGQEKLAYLQCGVAKSQTLMAKQFLVLRIETLE